MDASGSGGLGAVSFGVSEVLLALIILVAVLFGIWKLATIIWAALSG